MSPVPKPVGWLAVAAMVVLPAWGNRGPGTSSAVDLLLAPLALWFVVDAVRQARLVRTPFLLPAVVFIAAGAVAGAFGKYPGTSLLAVTIDGYLLLACLAVTRIVADDGWGRRIALGWCAGAVGWSVPLLLATGKVIPESAWGALATSNGRALGTFDNPNLAGSYYAVSLFVVWATLRSRPARLAAAAVVLVSLALSGSIAALLGTALAVLTLGIARLFRVFGRQAQHRPRRAGAVLLAALAAVIGLGIAGPAVADVPGEIAASPALHNSLGRFDRSDSSRSTIWSLGADNLGDHVLVGVGPGAAGNELRHVSDEGKSLHSDVLASLLERGIVGAAALLALVGSLGWVAVRLARSRLPWLVSPAVLAVSVIAVAPGFVTHEILHFRHLWLLIGVLTGALLPRPSPIARRT